MPTSNLLEYLSKLPDHRMMKKASQRLNEMMFVAICVVIRGAQG